MNRRAFIKGLIALASAPAIGKYVNVFKTEGAREGIEQVASQGVDFFNSVIKKVMDEGTLVNESDRIQTFRHPDRPDIDVEVDLGTGNANVSFKTDTGTEGYAGIEKDMELGMSYPGELIDDGLEGGITNLEEFLKSKKGFAAGGRVGFKYGGGSMISESDLKNLQGSDMDSLDYFDLIGDELSGEELEGILRLLKALDYKKGGRVGMFRGGIPKGLQAALRAIMSKYGDDAITTADKVESKSKVFDDFEARNPNPNKQMTDEEIKEFADEFGLDPSEEYYNWDGTLADARRLLKESEDETKYMYQQYKAGRLDPKSGEKGREKFLEKKLEEAELSGESKLITRDEIEELEELKAVREAAPQMMERLELKARYPGITDDLLDSILIDDNPQRKAEVLATLDEAFAMMRKGKGPDEVLRIIKDMNRTKQADGGSIDGDVSLTVIKIPDISESGVESLFKRR